MHQDEGRAIARTGIGIVNLQPIIEGHELGVWDRINRLECVIWNVGAAQRQPAGSEHGNNG